MVVPGMMNMAEVMAESGDTEEDVFDCGISGQLVFVVVVPLVGACRVPVEALSHFMAGADDYAAEGMPEHWSAALSGKWTIKRDRLRILADSWDKLSTERDKTIEAFEAKFKPKQANVQRAHRLAANCYEIYEAAASIALQLGQDKTNEERLREDMAQAAFDGKLTVRSPSGYDQYAPTRSPEWTYDYCALTTPGDVNKWAEERGLHWTWEPNRSAPPAASVLTERLGDIDQTPDPERRLARLRALGGNPKYSRGEWSFTGTDALVKSEESEGRKRRSEKTIRADLKEAAQAELDAKAAGVFDGLGKR